MRAAVRLVGERSASTALTWLWLLFRKGAPRCFKDAGWLPFMNKTAARNLGQDTHARACANTHTKARSINKNMVLQIQ